MSQRPLSVALAVLDARARAQAAAIAGAVAAERALLVVAAVVLARDDRRGAFAATAALVVLYFARALLRGSLRVHLQRRLHRLAADALLAGDPLVAPPLDDADPEAVLLDGVHQGSVLLAERLPSLAGDLVACVGIAAFLAATQPAGVLAVAGVAATLAAVTGFAMRRLTARAQDAAWGAYRPLLDRMLIVIRGRTELVANGAAPRFSRDLDRHLGVFERETLRAERLTGLVGRAALLAGAAGAVLGLAVQRGPGGLEGAALADAVLFASVAPAFLGVAQSAHETWKLSLVFRPMAALLTIPPLARTGREPPPSSRAPIELRDVGFRYPGAKEDAVSGVSLAFARGEPLVLRGPNGSGKSTVLRLIAALAVPSRGAVSANGRDLREVDVEAWQAEVAYLPQSPLLPESMTVGESLRILAPDATDDAARAALERTGVLDVLARRAPGAPLGVKVGELSTGQRKRVAIARVLLSDADVVLLDEPDANLDVEGAAMVARIVGELAKTRLVAVAAHTPALVGAPGVHIELAA